jgi:hypothetical protein
VVAGAVVEVVFPFLLEPFLWPLPFDFPFAFAVVWAGAEVVAGASAKTKLVLPRNNTVIKATINFFI